MATKQHGSQSSQNPQGLQGSQTLQGLRRRAAGVRLLATDLDGTLLDRTHSLSAENKAALSELARKGVVLAAATGRSRTSIPEAVTALEGLKYLITANGAKIYENGTEKILYESYLSAEAVDYIRPFLSDREVLCEVFWDGAPHVEEARYKGAPEYGIPFWFSDYFFSSRLPIRDFEAAVRAHENEIENINFVFANETVKERIRQWLKAREGLYELTTSLAFNFEIGGLGVCKAAAVDFIAKRESVRPEETICFGDNDNDISMIEYAGIGIAAANGVDEALAAADFVTKDCGQSAVAYALKTLGLIAG
ncbi:MAG: HAD family hydrolase [Clostridiales Family XIII bacterium]|nr:HAD family hydrolase [Clostridiales Family XIII bacterium]